MRGITSALRAAIGRTSRRPSGGVDRSTYELAPLHPRDCDRRLANYRKALDLTDDPTPFIEWINEVQKERHDLEAQLGRSVPGGTLTKSQVKAIVRHLRRIVPVLADADPADEAELYGQLGVSLTYHRDGRLAVELLPRGADVRVGGASATPSTREPWEGWLAAP